MEQSIEMPTRSRVSDIGNHLEAIASGVRARIEQETGYSRMVTEKTVYIARAMKINESEIQEWLKQEEKRLQEIKDLLRKLAERKPPTTL